jgi:hypothetical protein
MLDMLRRIRTAQRHRRPDVLLRNARWVAEVQEIPTLWTELTRPPHPTTNAEAH